MRRDVRRRAGPVVDEAQDAIARKYTMCMRPFTCECITIFMFVKNHGIKQKTIISKLYAVMRSWGHLFIILARDKEEERSAGEACRALTGAGSLARLVSQHRVEDL